MRKVDRNGVPLKIEVSVCYIMDEDDREITYDEEEMKKEFDEMLSLLPQQGNK